LELRPDSTGRGWIQDRERRLNVTRWRVAYLSADAPESRADNGLDLQDGGDMDCTAKQTAECRSAPVLCITDTLAEADHASRCLPFAFRRDSLKISTKSWYVRVAATEPRIH
jgi:hypothetical protein